MYTSSEHIKNERHMKASVLDFRRRMKDILRALDRNEPVTIYYRGKRKGVIFPVRSSESPSRSLKEHPAVGMWKDRDDMKDGRAVMDRLRGVRRHVV